MKNKRILDKKIVDEEYNIFNELCDIAVKFIDEKGYISEFSEYVEGFKDGDLILSTVHWILSRIK